MQIQRPLPRQTRNRTPMIACGCLAVMAGIGMVLVVAVILLLPVLPGLALQFSGFEPQGNTEQVFADVPPVPPVEVQNPVSPTQVVLNLGQFGQQELPQTLDYTVAVGSSAAGGQLATVTFTEAALMDLCYQRSDICSNTNPQYRNARLDLRPGGGVVYADVFIQQFGIWQPVGVVMRLDASKRQFAIAGVDVNGTLYTLPPNDMSVQIGDIVTSANQVLQQLSLEASGGRYALSEVQLTDTTATLVLR